MRRDAVSAEVWQNHLKYMREFQARRYWNNPEAERARRIRVNLKRHPIAYDPIKHKARVLLYQAVVKGKVMKPKACSKCGMNDTSRRIHGHHTDYSRPLDVVWLCSRCHGMERRKAA